MLTLKDPVEAIRPLFRKLWSIRDETEAEAYLSRLYTESIQPLLDSDASLNHQTFQNILFEEKRRLEDIESIATLVNDQLREKADASRLMQFPETADDPLPPVTLLHQESIGGHTKAPVQSPPLREMTPLTSTPGTGTLDLAGMIDHMLEEERLKSGS